MQRSITLWQGSIEGSNSAEFLVARTLLALKSAVDIEIVHHDVILLRYEEVRFCATTFRIQDALLLVVVVHGRLADELLPRLRRRAKVSKISILNLKLLKSPHFVH